MFAANTALLVRNDCKKQEQEERRRGGIIAFASKNKCKLFDAVILTKMLLSFRRRKCRDFRERRI